MKANVVAAAVLSALGMAAHAQTVPGVTLFGVLDMSVRVSNAQGAGGKDTLKTATSGGLAPSRIGINVVEDLGGGMKAIAGLDHRFQMDSGTPDPGPFWQQSWVGLQSPAFGRVTVGRNYNVLFDVLVTTFAPFLPVGPVINQYKPEIALGLGIRNDNQVKYTLASGAFTAEAQVSAGEGAPFSPTTGKSWGGMLRYASNGIALGAGVLERRDNDRKARTTILGAAYTSGPMYLNASWGRSTFDDGLNAALLLVGTGVENVVVPARPGQLVTRVDKRDLWSIGGMYEVLPRLQVGAQWWTFQQRFHTPGAPDGKAKFFAVLADYALSKRTDVYASIERTSVTDLQLTNMATGAPNGADARTALMLGMRHRF